MNSRNIDFILLTAQHDVYTYTFLVLIPKLQVFNVVASCAPE